MRSVLSILEYTVRDIPHQDWITLLIFGSLLILATIRFLYPKRFQEFIELPLTDKYFAMQGKGYQIQHPFNIGMFIFQSLVFSLFFYLILTVVDPISEKNQWLFLQIITGFSVFVLIKYVLEKIIAHIFNIEKIINSYLFEKLSYTSLISLLVLVLNILLVYTMKPQIELVIGLMLVIAGLFAISLVSSFKRNGNIILQHFFYFILYLCALEIAPYIIVYKLVM